MGRGRATGRRGEEREGGENHVNAGPACTASHAQGIVISCARGVCVFVFCILYFVFFIYFFGFQEPGGRNVREIGLRGWERECVHQHRSRSCSPRHERMSKVEPRHLEAQAGLLAGLELCGFVHPYDL